MTGNAPSMIGLSWLAVEMTSSLAPRFTSQAQPEPKRVVAAVVNCFLKLSKDWKVELMAEARVPAANCLLVMTKTSSTMSPEAASRRKSLRMGEVVRGAADGGKRGGLRPK